MQALLDDNASAKTAPAFGALSGVTRDNLYWFGPRGFIFTSPWVVTPSTVRHSAVLLLTASGDPVEVSAGDHVVKRDMVAIAPQTRRGLAARNVGLVSVHVFPPHPFFSAFQRLPARGVLALDRTRLSSFDGAIARVYEGRLSLPEAQALFEDVVGAAVAQLPQSGQREPRVHRLHELLQENPACSLAELAKELRLSYSGTSRHFARAVGLPLRSYRLWLKYYTAADTHMKGSSWTEAAHAAGFTDSSHLVRTWQASYGFSPSYTGDEKRVRIFTRSRDVR
ncbi:MAG: transcriptional regulator, AraC family [Rhizobacter sp.]|nr:transcriptional regulator, AraC family [Rhizobacter sp.]